MRRTSPLALLLPLLLLATPLRAEIVTLRDGSTWDGTIENRNFEGFDLRIRNGAITTLKHINIMDITDLAPSKPAPPPPAPAPKAPPAAATTPPDTQPDAPPAKPAFFKELLDTALGHGPDDLTTLPQEIQAQWNATLRSEALGDRPETLQRLYKLQDAFDALPHGPSRLDAISRRYKKLPFGLWEAQIHWDAIYSRMKGGVVDVGEVRDSEKDFLVGLLKEKTTPALEPLKQYFPPIDPKTGRPQPFTPKQLSGITLNNALELKDKATWASTVLLAQLKVEPEMPESDRALILTQLTNVRRILTRARQLEPAAKAAAQKSRH
jgi:hypothetical protein